MIAYKPSGEPGYDQSSFWIRGISSYRGTTTPLVLVDGIERTLDDLDVEQIESFSVLKDASASAMYGVRGANGVIVITTKRGKIGKPTVSVGAVASGAYQIARIRQRGRGYGVAELAVRRG